MLAALDQDDKSEQTVCALADHLLGEESGLSLRNTIVVVKALILPRVCGRPCWTHVGTCALIQARAPFVMVIHSYD
jgi:hypothetical protein